MEAGKASSASGVECKEGDGEEALSSDEDDDTEAMLQMVKPLAS